MTSSCIAAEDGSLQVLAAPVDPAELAAATLAHQASLDMSAMQGAGSRQTLAGRDAGSLNQQGAPLHGSSQCHTAGAEKPAAQRLFAHAAGAVLRVASLTSFLVTSLPRHR